MRETASTRGFADLLASEAERFERNATGRNAQRERRYVRARRPEAPAQVYSVRIPVDRLEDVRRTAEREGMQPSSMLREWILERLDREAIRSTDGARGEVGEAFARQVVLEIAEAARDFAQRGFGSATDDPSVERGRRKTAGKAGTKSVGKAATATPRRSTDPA